MKKFKSRKKRKRVYFEKYFKTPSDIAKYKYIYRKNNTSNKKNYDFFSRFLGIELQKIRVKK